ncbi:bifunctional methylenetetrahydrofolate dehydrogenase/methenyltetrahydrofolate cyclohydrolase FolD [soil metagenome]
MKRCTPVILDGRAFAAQRAPQLAARGAVVTAQRGRAPLLLIVAFGDPAGYAPHVRGKVRSCAGCGVDCELVVLPPGTGTAEAVHRMRAAIDAVHPDGVFVQFPFPADIDGDALAVEIPVACDVDIMTPVREQQFLLGDGLPPVTVSAALLLLDEQDIDIAGRHGIVVADASPFADMFRAALERRGALLAPLVDPSADGLPARAAAAELVVAAAGSPGMLSSRLLRPGCVAIDVGYFNPGGRGDIDTSAGIAQLAALMPVPGGIGPMTVSALVERVIDFAGG